MRAFSNRDPVPFAPQQVWASSFGIGLILFVFTAFQGIGGHFPGADVAFMEARPDLVNNVLGAGLGGKDLMESAGKQGMLVPQLIHLAPAWAAGLLAVCALAAMQCSFFGIGPGAVIGNTIFGSPNDATTRVFGMPSIRAMADPVVDAGRLHDVVSCLQDGDVDGAEEGGRSASR